MSDGKSGAACQPSAASALTENGRGADGKFGAGNKFGRGNPNAKRMARFRAVFLETVTDKHLKEIVEMLTHYAIRGDLTAAKIVLDYSVGRPVPTDIDQKEDDRDESAAGVSVTNSNQD